MKRRHFSVVSPQFTTSTTPVGADDDDDSASECELQCAVLDGVDCAPLVNDAIDVGDDEFVNEELRRIRRQEGWLPNNGVAKRRKGGRFGEAYLEEVRRVDAAIRNDPRFEFVQLVAGFTNQETEDVFDQTAIEAETERFVSAQQRRVQADRDSAGALQRLANEINSIDERIVGAERSVDALADAQLRLCSALTDYRNGIDRANEAYTKADYLRNVREGEISRFLTRSVAAFPRNLFDLLTRWAIMAYGDWETAFSQNLFTDKLESIVDVAAEAVKDRIAGQITNAEVAANMPATSRLALYIATLHAIVTANLHTRPLRSAAFAAGSSYAAQPSAYGEALRRLYLALFRSGGEGLNYLNYDTITLGLYAVLVDMHRASGSAAPRPARPQVAEQAGDGPASRSRRNPKTVGGVEVILEIPDEDLLGALESGGAEDDDGTSNVGMTPEQLRDMRNKPQQSVTISEDIVSLLLELLRPAVTGYMPQMLYRPPTLDRDSLESQAGGVSDETRLLFAWVKSVAADDDDDDDVDDKLARVSSRFSPQRRSKRTTRSRFRRVAADVDPATLRSAEQQLTPEYGNLAGVLVLAIGIFHHALVSNSTDISIEHLLAEAVPFLPELATAVERALLLELQAQAPAYIEFYRRELQRRQLLEPAARAVQALQDAAAQMERVDGTEQFFEYANRTRAALPAFTALDVENEQSVDRALTALEKRLANATDYDGTRIVTTDSVAFLLQVEEQLCDDASSPVAQRLALLRNRLDTLRESRAQLATARQRRILEEDQARVDRAGEEARDTAVVDPAVAMSFRNTGIFRLTPLLMAGIAAAAETVRSNVLSLAYATTEFLQTEPSVRVLFAQLVAAKMNKATILNPTMYRSDGSLNLSLRSEVSIVNEMRVRVGDVTRWQAAGPQPEALVRLSQMSSAVTRMLPTALRPVMRLPFGESTFR